MIRKKNVKRYCRDDISKIENYDKAIADKKNMWDCHHRLELTLEGEFAHSNTDLKRFNMYYHRPYFELIFLLSSEHKKIHARTKIGVRSPRHGKKHSEETRQKMSKSHKGKPSPWKGKKRKPYRPRIK